MRISGTYSCLFLIKSLRCKEVSCCMLLRMPKALWMVHTEGQYIRSHMHAVTGSSTYNPPTSQSYRCSPGHMLQTPQNLIQHTQHLWLSLSHGRACERHHCDRLQAQCACWHFQSPTPLQSSKQTMADGRALYSNPRHRQSKAGAKDQQPDDKVRTRQMPTLTPPPQWHQMRRLALARPPHWLLQPYGRPCR